MSAACSKLFETYQDNIKELQVKYLAFSLHTDAKGIIDLVQHVDPAAVMLVHGEKPKMEFLARRMQASLQVPCYMPANGEALQIAAASILPVRVSEACMEEAMAAAGRTQAEQAVEVRILARTTLALHSPTPPQPSVHAQQKHTRPHRRQGIRSYVSAHSERRRALYICPSTPEAGTTLLKKASAGAGHEVARRRGAKRSQRSRSTPESSTSAKVYHRAPAGAATSKADTQC